MTIETHPLQTRRATPVRGARGSKSKYLCERMKSTVTSTVAKGTRFWQLVGEVSVLYRTGTAARQACNY